MKKGFTLIELLAVIVILAIIALIATPIVLSIIEETKESAVLRSAEHYLSSVELGVAKKSLAIGGSFSPTTCVVQSDGNLLCDGKDELKIEMNGETPSSGTITFEKGKIIAVELTQSNKTIVKNEKGELVLGEAKVEPVCKLIDDVAPTGISAGDKYQCKVKDNMETEWKDGYYFYVLSSEENGTTNLIMDRNINSDGTPAGTIEIIKDGDNVYNMVAWLSEDDASTIVPDDWGMCGSEGCISADNDGPLTAMKFLQEATKNWTNINEMSINEFFYDDGTSVKMSTFNTHARLPIYLTDETKTELLPAGFLVENLENKVGYFGSYWTFSTVANDTIPPGYVWTWTVANSTVAPMCSDYSGVRPVINVKL